MKRMSLAVVLGCVFAVGSISRAANEPRKLVFEGVLPEQRLTLKELGASIPDDWTSYTHLVMEMRTSSPQRFALWVYTKEGSRRLEIQPFGQNVWLRASIPLRYFNGMDQSGTDLASSINRRTNSFWMSVWGPFGELKNVEAVGFAMQYPIHKPTIELRNVHLSKQDEGSEFLDGAQVRDQWGQWAFVDYPRKIKSQEQLDKELADEEKSWGTPADFGYGKFGGYQSTQAKTTGFFHLEQVDGVWWLVDPEGHLFLSTSSNGIPGAGGARGRGNRGGAAPATQPGRGVPGQPIVNETTGNLVGIRGGAATQQAQSPAPNPGATAAANRTVRRLGSWGFNTGGANRPTIAYFNAPRSQPMFLGVGDFYSDAFAQSVEQAGLALSQRKDDPLLVGYFIGNEPPWGDRESEVVDMMLAGPDTATKTRLKEWIAQGDTPKRRKEFVVKAFEHYLELVCATIRKNDPNHLIVGIRFGGTPADDVIRLGRYFDVCSINVYEYEPTKQLERAYRLCGRPILIGEFHLGVPENGLGSGLVQAMNQTERGKGYRYYVEQALSLPYCLGAHWFTWTDESVTGRGDGENYNIGFVDSTGRPYPELVEAAKETHKRLQQVHAGKIAPFNQKPMASEAGSPSSPWDIKP